MVKLTHFYGTALALIAIMFHFKGIQTPRKLLGRFSINKLINIFSRLDPTYFSRNIKLVSELKLSKFDFVIFYLLIGN
jgi:hypothetical protein